MSPTLREGVTSKVNRTMVHLHIHIGFGHGHEDEMLLDFCMDDVRSRLKISGHIVSDGDIRTGLMSSNFDVDKVVDMCRNLNNDPATEAVASELERLQNLKLTGMAVEDAHDALDIDTLMEDKDGSTKTGTNGGESALERLAKQHLEKHMDKEPELFLDTTISSSLGEHGIAGLYENPIMDNGLIFFNDTSGPEAGKLSAAHLKNVESSSLVRDDAISHEVEEGLIEKNPSIWGVRLAGASAIGTGPSNKTGTPNYLRIRNIMSVYALKGINRKT